jgi:amidophosphoribosyltransferase
VHKGMGLVSDVFTEPVLAKLKGDMAVGHVRYSTTGSSVLRLPALLKIATGSIC